MKPITLFVRATKLNASAQSLLSKGSTLSLWFASPTRATPASLFCSGLSFFCSGLSLCCGGNALRFAHLHSFAFPQSDNPYDPQRHPSHFWGSQHSANLDDCVKLSGDAHESKGSITADRAASLVSDLLPLDQVAYKRRIKAAMETAIDKMPATRWSTAGLSGLYFGSLSIPLSF